MVGPVFDVSPKVSSRYTAPTFEGLMRGGDALGRGLGAMGARMREDKKAAEINAAMNSIFSGYQQTGQMNIPEGSNVWGTDAFGDIMNYVNQDQSRKFQREQFDWQRAASDRDYALRAAVANRPKGVSPTTRMKEYDLAKQQGYEGTFLDYMEATKSSGTTVNIGGEGQGPTPLELSGQLQDYRTAAEQARAAGDTEGAAKYDQAAQILEKELKLTGPGQGDRDAAGALHNAYQSLDSMMGEISQNGMPIPFISEDSKQLEQHYQNLRGAMINLEKRGANFSKNEEKLIEGVLGGGPNDFLTRGRDVLTGAYEGKTGAQVYLERLQEVGNILAEKEYGLRISTAGAIPSSPDFAANPTTPQPSSGLEGVISGTAPVTDVLGGAVGAAQAAPAPEAPGLPSGLSEFFKDATALASAPNEIYDLAIENLQNMSDAELKTFERALELRSEASKPEQDAARKRQEEAAAEKERKKAEIARANQQIDWFLSP